MGIRTLITALVLSTSNAKLSNTVSDSSLGWTYLGNLTSPVPAYTFLIDVTNDGIDDLLVNGFAFGKAGSIGLVRNAKDLVANIATEEVQSETIFDDLFWPNWAEKAPAGVFDTADVNASTWLVIADGFLLPGSTPGNVYALALDGEGELIHYYSLTGTKYNPLKYGTFYALTEFVQIRGEGDSTVDILATKVHSELFGSFEQPKLVLLSRPVDDEVLGSWEETTLIEGEDGTPDFAFATREFVDAAGVRKMAIVTGSFTKSTLALYEADLSSYPPTISEAAIIDTDAGPIYSTQFVDINGDGIDELLVSNHEEDEYFNQSAVFAYELPAKTADWYAAAPSLTRHTIASGFKVLNPDKGKAAPGFPLPYYPDGSQATGRMHIIVQGDDNGAVYVLSPTGEDFVYSRAELRLYGDRVGLPSMGDVDGDGFVEMFVPDYANDLVHAYTTKP